MVFKKLGNRIYNWLNSPIFFRLILVFFLFEAAWIAVSAAYPQAFDENFHFGLIQVYSHYWLPFLSSQPPHANAYGAVARDPSYLYHYLMSFPYRFITLFIHSQIQQVIILRFINIGFFAAGLILFRRILLRTRLSRPLVNCSLLIFILIPIVPQLAAQINYDDLLFPLTALTIIMTFNLTDQLRARRPSLRTALLLLSLCLLTSLVKYAYLPIFAGIVFFLLWITFKQYRHQARRLLTNLRTSWRQQSRLVQAGLIIAILISGGMFMQRDGINIIKYHAVAPDCGQVLSVKDCSAYSPWYYNYQNHAKVLTARSNGSLNLANPIAWLAQWFYWMWYRLFFAVNGLNSRFVNYPPLPLPAAAAVLLGAVGLVGVIRWRHRIFHGNSYLILLFIVSACYVGALIVQGYSTYRYTDVLENMNGRYLLPILLFLAAIIGRALSLQLRRVSGAKALIAAVVLVLFLEGGGLFTFISRSDTTWYIQNTAVQHINSTAHKITEPVLVDGKRSYSTRLWFFN